MSARGLPDSAVHYRPACRYRALAVGLVALRFLAVASALVGVPSEFSMNFQYDVVFSPHSLSVEDFVTVSDDRLYPMRLANGSSYFCLLPPSEEEVVANHMNAHVLHGLDAQEYRDEGGFALTEGEVVPLEFSRSLHESLSAPGCLSSKKGYWTYTICLGHYVLQHNGPEVLKKLQQGGAAGERLSPKMPVFYLGITTGEYELSKEEGHSIPPIRRHRKDVSWDVHYTFHRDHEGAYLSSFYPYGTECDLTGNSRQSEVQIRCLEDGDVATDLRLDVEEVSACAYRVVVHTREACIPPLQTPVKSLAIVCYPVMAP